MNKIEEAITTSDEATRKAFLKPFSVALGSEISSIPGLLREFESLTNYRKAKVAEEKQVEEEKAYKKNLSEAVETLKKAGVKDLEEGDPRAEAWMKLPDEKKAKYAALLGAKPISGSGSTVAVAEGQGNSVEGAKTVTAVRTMFPSPITAGAAK